MKITQNHLRIAILVLAGLLILYGVLKSFTDIAFPKELEDNVTNIIFFGAAAIFLWNRSIGDKEKKQREAEAAAAEAAAAEAAAAEASVAEAASTTTISGEAGNAENAGVAGGTTDPVLADDSRGDKPGETK